MIKWDEILEGYNRIRRRNGFPEYKTEKEMFEALYSETRSSLKMEDIFGITSPTIRNRMRDLGIVIQKRGGHVNIFSKVVWHKDRTIKDIIKETQERFNMGIRSGAYQYAKLHNKPYKKLNPQGRPVKNEL